MDTGPERRRVAFVWLMIEGGQVALGGVARYVENLLAAQDDIRAEWEQRGRRIDFVLAEPACNPGAPGYDGDRWRATDAYLRARGGRAVRLVTDGDGTEQWGGERFFRTVSAAGAQVVLDAAGHYDAVVAVSGTSAFARVPGMVQRLDGPEARKVLHVHTFGLATHETAEPPTPPEIAADGDLAFWARQSPRVTVASISDHTTRLYERTYAVPRESLLPNRSGIPLEDPAFAVLEQEEAARVLAEAGIPERGRLAVMWGRNSAPGLDKGYHLLLEAAREVPGIVPVIATRRPAPDLADLARRLGVEAVFLEDQPFPVISALLQSERTLVAAFLGEAEPGAVSPMEAMWVARESGALVLAADTGNLPELVDGGEAGLLTRREGPAVAETLRSALKQSEPERERMRAAAVEVVRRDCDFHRNIAELVSAAMTRWEQL